MRQVFVAESSTKPTGSFPAGRLDLTQSPSPSLRRLFFNGQDLVAPQIESLKGDIGQLRGEVRGESAEFRSEVREEIGQLRSAMRGNHAAASAEIRRIDDKLT